MLELILTRGERKLTLLDDESLGPYRLTVEDPSGPPRIFYLPRRDIEPSIVALLLQIGMAL